MFANYLFKKLEDELGDKIDVIVKQLMKALLEEEIRLTVATEPHQLGNITYDEWMTLPLNVETIIDPT